MVYCPKDEAAFPLALVGPAPGLGLRGGRAARV
jgi:hypothetical protein